MGQGVAWQCSICGLGASFAWWTIQRLPMVPLVLRHFSSAVCSHTRQPAQPHSFDKLHFDDCNRFISYSLCVTVDSRQFKIWWEPSILVWVIRGLNCTAQCSVLVEAEMGSCEVRCRRPSGHKRFDSVHRWTALSVVVKKHVSMNVHIERTKAANISSRAKQNVWINT